VALLDTNEGVSRQKLASKTVLVTGGSGSGIGDAIVRRFAAQSAKTAFIVIKEGVSRVLLANELAEQGHGVHCEPADLTDIAARDDRRDPRRVRRHSDSPRQRRP
jgi:NAD(P)-dependent dehydrogenase (short-subunit alcohol dehydrogenase family)